MSRVVLDPGPTSPAPLTTTVFAHRHGDEKITIGNERGPLRNAKLLLTEARRGPDAFGNVPMLHIFPDKDLVGAQRVQMIRSVRAAAIDAGYQRVQVAGDGGRKL